MVAPFEADAQLAYLNKEGYADVVITEDSDLLVFGCIQVIFYCVVGKSSLFRTNECLTNSKIHCVVDNIYTHPM